MTECKENDLLSIVRSIKQSDFKMENFLRLAFKVSYWSNGGINYQAMSEMTTQEFKVVVDEAERLQKAANEEQDKFETQTREYDI